MSSRQRTIDGHGSPAFEGGGGAWTPLFVVALALFLGGLMLLTDAVIHLPRHRPATAVETALEADGERTARRPADSGHVSTMPGPAETVLDPMTPLPAWDDAVLRRAIEHALGADIEHTSVVVRRLADGRSASVNGGREYYAASTFKLAILYEAERRRSLGELDLDSVVYLNDDDLSEDLGTLDYLPLEADGGVRIRAALEAMIAYSDNSSAVALLHLLGGGAIDETLRELGLTVTSVNTRDLPTTATDLALLMQAIVEGRGLSKEARDEARSFLLAQKTRDGIPAGLPWDMPVGNKTGTWEGATHDVAFVEAPGGTYVIAILSDKGWAWEPLQRVSNAVIGELWRRP